MIAWLGRRICRACRVLVGDDRAAADIALLEAANIESHERLMKIYAYVADLRRAMGTLRVLAAEHEQKEPPR